MARLTKEQEQSILDAYRDTPSIQKVADKLSFGKNTVHRALKRNGIKCVKNKYTPDQEKYIVEQYLVGKSMASIMGEIGLANYHTFRMIIKRHGVNLRRRGNKLREMTESERSCIVERWRNGESRHKLCKELSISHVTLNRWLIQLGETPQNRGRKGEEHPHWKGGRVVSSFGYVQILLERNDPYYCMANGMGYTPEHRLVMAEHLRRPLLKHETVHHINGDRTDNCIENLQLRIGSHGIGQAYCCAECGSKLINPIPLD